MHLDFLGLDFLGLAYVVTGVVLAFDYLLPRLRLTKVRRDIHARLRRQSSRK